MIRGESNFDDKYVEKGSTCVEPLFNWSEFQISEMTCYKIHTLRAELIWSKDPDVTLSRLKKSLDPNLFWRGSIAFFDDSSMSFVHTDAKFELRYHSYITLHT